ncbi:serine/threonine protein phosphatase [Actinoplanes sp. NPDC023801]|uniref:serine/threonine protein phosphatase n=1 Tax=Actinoplanes sp. NPDC023801 TaxID=3154595 RepID=UPI003402D61C
MLVDEPDLPGRRDRHHALSQRLAALDDGGLAALLDAPPAPGFGGAVATATVGGVPMFVKFVPLSDLERQHAGSTANLFGLPMFYQYGIGSAGFGAWREIAVHDMTTRWVLDGLYDAFPLVYHWRVVPYRPVPMDPAEMDRWVAHWDGDAAVRGRLEAISGASAAVVVFMEHVAQTVDAWLTDRVAAGGAIADEAFGFVRTHLRDGVDFMRSQGLTHFDAHFRNLLTDGRRIYFADFGLALHSGFDLDDAGRDFARGHRDYDHGQTAGHFSQWLVSNLAGVPWPRTHAFLREHADNLAGTGLPASAVDVIAANAPVSAVMGRFVEELWSTSKRTPFPAGELAKALRA